MVHALHEASRVLKPNSCAIDLRPRAEHCRIGLRRDGILTTIGMTAESLQNYRAAEAAVTVAEERKLLRNAHSVEFSITTDFPSIEDLRAWLYDLDEDVPKAQSDKLVHEVELTQQTSLPRSEIVAAVPFVLIVLEKVPD